jgi:tripartite-type tricarboxylate transporter receptor subunit TctC
MLAKIPNVLVVRNALPVATLNDLIDFGKANPGKLSYASQGWADSASLRRPARAASRNKDGPRTLSGRTTCVTTWSPGTSICSSIRLRLRRRSFAKASSLLGVADAKRADMLPSAHHIGSGPTGFRSITWFGLVAPPATPGALAAKINHDAVEILNSDDVVNMLRKLSLSQVQPRRRRRRGSLPRRRPCGAR